VLFDGSEHEITGYFSYDIDNDIAIISVDGNGREFKPVTLGRSGDVSIGDRVYAIGGPGGDPLTLTEGLISRFANEPLRYDIYTIAGMLQTTAFVYGGNSGGPLFDDKGNVIGINSATHIERESAQWAVPIDRVSLPSSSISVSSLPVGTVTPTHVPGQIFGYSRFPFIPDFLSVSNNAYLILSGTASDLEMELILDIDTTGIYKFDYVAMYHIEVDPFIEDAIHYGIVLFDYGFDYQDAIDVFNDDAEVAYIFFYNSEQDVSLVYVYYTDEETFLVLIGHGNAHEQLTGTITNAPPPFPGNNNFIGYPNYPFVPDLGATLSSADLLDSGFAADFGIEEFEHNGNYYIVADDYMYIYYLPVTNMEDLHDYYALFSEDEYEVVRDSFYEDITMVASLLYHYSTGVFVSILYDVEDELVYIVIG